MNTTLRESQVSTNGINLHVVEAGPESGKLVILLHGFPEFWWGWHNQIEALSKAGYRVVAPDQRGYNLSDKPTSVHAYRIDELARDVTGLIDHYGREKACIVGHDWGGAVAWWLANKYPERVEKLAVLNIPHHRVMLRNLKSNFRQLSRSWYIFFFQLPKLPELLMRAGGCKIAERSLVGSSRPGTFPPEALAKYREAWTRGRSLRSMVNWYRAALRTKPPRVESARITVPTLLIWGTGDKFLGAEMAKPSIDLCDEGRLELIPGASHWVQHEEPARVNELLRGFFS